MLTKGMAELITYKAEGTGSRIITAAVERGGAEPIAGVMAEGFSVTVLNDATYGISAAELDCGADRLGIAERVGGSESNRGNIRLTGQDGNFLNLAVN